MVGWKLIGFPGARYDYRPYVAKHGEQLEPRRRSASRAGRTGRPRRKEPRHGAQIAVGRCRARRLRLDGAILGQELTDAGLQVLALERGGWRDTPTDFAVTFAQDELRYYWRRALFQQPAHETLTFRNSPSETALPMRQLGSFLPGTGVGGAGIHWNGMTWRFLPTDFIATQPQHRALRRRARCPTT